VKKEESPSADGRYRSASAYESLVGFSRAVRRGSRISVSLTAPIDSDGETVEGDAYVQAARCFDIMLEAVEALDGTREDVVRTRMYSSDASNWDAVSRAHGEFFRDIYPASTLVIVREHLDPRWQVEIEAEAEVLT